MEQIDLIGLLISNPKTDREIGFNDAVIIILKASNNIDGELTKHQMVYNDLKKKMDTDHQTLLKFTNHVVEQSKLAFVKDYKDLMGMGLKEAKDFADPIWERFC